MTDDANPDMIPLAWLGHKVSIEQAEADHPGVTDERVTRFPEMGRPFGGLSGRWEALKAAIKPGDELWTFASPAESWQHLAGRAGIALLRDGRVVDVVLTLMN